MKQCLTGSDLIRQKRIRNAVFSLFFLCVIVALSSLSDYVLADQANRQEQNRDYRRPRPDLDRPVVDLVEIEILLDDAVRLIRQRQLTTPVGNSAVDRLSEVLWLDPLNVRARQLFQEVIYRYAEWANTAMYSRQFGQARRHAEQALDVAALDALAFGTALPELAGLHLIRGDSLAEQGQPSAARAAYFYALELFPGLDAAREGLAELDSMASEPAGPATVPVQPESAPVTESTTRKKTDSILGIPRVLDTASLAIRDEILNLYGVVGQGPPFSTDLQAFIRDREVSCDRFDPRSFICTLGDTDLSELVLLNGAAKARNDAPDHLKAQQSRAQNEQKGIWQ
jgi:tetratricopeptide (TPR) repeat protein